MIWLTLRQFRVQMCVAAAVLVLFAVLLGVTGPGLAHLYTGSGLAACHAPSNCSALTTTFLDEMKSDSTYTLVYFLTAAVTILAPALIGAFWGAPLITHEVEAHTLRLVWYQSVTRSRWTAAKLGLLGLISIVFTGLLSLMTTWWAAPIDDAGGFPINQGQLSRFSPQIFDARGVAPLGYAAFAFVLGVSLGMLTKRTVPAMAITLVVFAAIQIAVPAMVRPAMITPETQTSTVLTVSDLNDMTVQNSGALTVPVDIPNAWIVSNQTVTPDGHQFILTAVPACQDKDKADCVAWLAQQDLRQKVTYQPAGRYWDFQWYETAMFLVLAALLAGFCLTWVHRGYIA
jgi:ABC-type transport system involved in multi-copper enzyme maturation permease subunit